MLIIEQGSVNPFTTDYLHLIVAHIGAVSRYSQSVSGDWTLSANQAQLTNRTTGGGDFGYNNWGPDDQDNCDDAIVVMSEAIAIPGGRVDGIEIMNSNSSGQVPTSNKYLVDLTGPITNDKYTSYDLEVVGNCAGCVPTPIQIGNYVWFDDDQDGVQDPCELPVPNLPVTLFTKAPDGTLTQVATTTTDGTTGEYYFNEVEPETEYLIAVGDLSTPPLFIGGVEYTLSPLQSGEGDNPGLNDSDAVFDDVNGNLAASICYTTSTTTNHTLDVGIYEKPPCNENGMGDELTVCENNNAIIDLNDLLIGSDLGGEWTAGVSNDANGTFDAVAATFDPTDATPSATYTFEYLHAVDPCTPDPAVVTINIDALPNIGTPSNITVCAIDDAPLNLIDQLAGADAGGVWTADAGNPASGTFDAMAGTFNPAGSLGGTYSFTYTLTPVICNPVMETVIIIVQGLDLGDLPDVTITGVTAYPTQLADSGPSHCVPASPTIKIGATVDTESDGQPSELANGDDSDEDGFDPDAQMFIRGQAQDLTIPVMNMSGSQAKLTLFIDWDGDGDLTGANEMYSTNVADMDTEALLSNITPPADAVINTNLGVRFRLSTDMAAVMSPTGNAPDGEVEDYLIQVMAFDYGDLADVVDGSAENDYETSVANGGPSHKLTTDDMQNIILKIGADVDDELDGQPSPDADGDDADEDGFDPAAQMFILEQSQDLTIPVMNMTGGAAKLTLFIDWNNDG
ncbi:MAG: SdrD B-like domain-containing protein, partial [Bacteroidota bacterium]